MLTRLVIGLSKRSVLALLLATTLSTGSFALSARADTAQFPISSLGGIPGYFLDSENKSVFCSWSNHYCETGISQGIEVPTIIVFSGYYGYYVGTQLADWTNDYLATGLSWGISRDGTYCDYMYCGGDRRDSSAAEGGVKDRLQTSEYQWQKVSDKAYGFRRTYGESNFGASMGHEFAQLVSRFRQIKAMSSYESNADDKAELLGSLDQTVWSFLGIEPNGAIAAMAELEKTGSCRAVNPLLEKSAENLGVEVSDLRDELLPSVGMYFPNCD